MRILLSVVLLNAVAFANEGLPCSFRLQGAYVSGVITMLAPATASHATPQATANTVIELDSLARFDVLRVSLHSNPDQGRDDLLLLVPKALSHRDLRGAAGRRAGIVLATADLRPVTDSQELKRVRDMAGYDPNTRVFEENPVYIFTGSEIVRFTLTHPELIRHPQAKASAEFYTWVYGSLFSERRRLKVKFNEGLSDAEMRGLVQDAALLGGAVVDVCHVNYARSVVVVEASQAVAREILRLPRVQSVTWDQQAGGIELQPIVE